MQAELREIGSARESILWLAGGVMSLGKAWWRELWRGRNAGEIDPAPVKAPGLLAWLTLAGALALLLAPTVRDGLRAVISTWRPNVWRAQEAELLRMAREAESKRDAETLAFAALSLQPSAESARITDEAVALDPSLTWIYARASFFSPSLTTVKAWPARLEAWDPENAVGHLVVARAREAELNPHLLTPSSGIENDPLWLAAMQKAFAAPHYDNYQARRIALNREVMARHDLRQPGDVMPGIFSVWWPNPGSLNAYGNWLLTRSAVAARRGDFSAAERDAWIVVHFVERIRGSEGSNGERWYGARLLRGAFAQLQPLEAAQGHTDAAAFFGEESKVLEHQSKPMREDNPLMALGGWWVDAGVRVLQAAGLVLMLLACGVMGSLFWLVVTQASPAMRTGRLHRAACRVLRFGPAGLMGAAALLLLAYRPYAEAIRYYSHGRPESDLLQVLAMLSVALHQPLFFMSEWRHAVWFWAGVLVVAAVGAALVLGRHFLRPVKKAAA